MDHQDFKSVGWSKKINTVHKYNHNETQSKQARLDKDELPKPKTWKGSILASFRTQKNMSQVVLAQKLNVKSERIKEWEKNVRPPGPIIHKLKCLFPEFIM